MHKARLTYKNGETREIITQDHLGLEVSYCYVHDVDEVFWVLFDVVKIEYLGELKQDICPYGGNKCSAITGVGKPCRCQRTMASSRI